MTAEPPAADPKRRVLLGRIGAPHGVRGWVRVWSYTEPPDELLKFAAWQVEIAGAGRRELKPEAWRPQGRGFAVRLAGIEDRDAAAVLTNAEIWIERSQMPPAPAGAYYQGDLLGLEVVTLDGRALGKVDHFLETPAHPVMVVRGERERWLPAVPRHVKGVDLAAGRVIVDWDPDF